MVVSADGFAVGDVKSAAYAAAPTNWLLCDGSAVSRTTYATLFAKIGTTYGAGNGTSTFNLPNGQQRVPMGAGSGGGLTTRVLGTNYGAESVVLVQANLPSLAHTHSLVDYSHPLLVYVGTGGNRADLAAGTVWRGTDSFSAATQSTDPGGTSTAFGIVPPAFTVSWFIKYQ